jgi:predicted alpha/beta-hydrolase family hydrolase
MSTVAAEPVTILLDDRTSVSGLLQVPAAATACFVLAHGAGAGMRHAFLETVATELAHHGIATLRYQFPYVERGSRRPDPPELCHATVRAAVAAAAVAATGLALFAGGKSFGGRMTSQAQGRAPLPGVQGLAFLGFPLHPDGKPSIARAEHLVDVSVPMLFLQGTRDKLADLALIEPVLAGLGQRATLRIIDQADHSFHVPARSGRTDRQVIGELAVAIAEWMNACIT